MPTDRGPRAHGVRRGRRVASGTCAPTEPASGPWTASADPAALATLYEALHTVSRLLAPAAPFASDWLHRALAGTSVHLARFPEPAGRRDPALEAAMDAVRRLASLAHGARQDRKLPVRQPLARMQVAVPAAVRGAGARRAARAAAARGEREGGRGRRLRRGARPAPGQAQLPLARQALRQADAGRRGGRGGPHVGAAARPGAGPDRHAGRRRRDRQLRARGRGGRARGGERLAGGERRPVRGRARPASHGRAAARRHRRARW